MSKTHVPSAERKTKQITTQNSKKKDVLTDITLALVKDLFNLLFNMLLNVNFSNGSHVFLLLMNCDMVDRPGDGHEVIEESQLCKQRHHIRAQCNRASYSFIVHGHSTK